MTESSNAVPTPGVKTEKEDGESELPSPAVTPFPIHALPEAIGTFAIASAASLSAPPELIAVPALVVAAAAIGNSRAIQLKEGWTEPASLFAAVVSPSGTMKTPALKMATEPIQGMDCPKIRTWTADVTVERLGALLAENPRGLLLVRDELSAWVKSMNQYKGGKGADRQFYLSAWAGVPLKVDRKGSGDGPNSISVPQPCLSVVGGIPPDVVHDLENTSGDDDGFLPRLLFSWPEPMVVRWVDQGVLAHVQAAYASRIGELLHITFKKHPLELPLTPEARELFIKWHDPHCDEMMAEGLQPFLRAAYAKFRGYCARLALIHAVTENPSAVSVGVDSVEAAIALIHYFKGQSQKVMSLVRTEYQGEIDRCRKEIFRKVSVCRSIQKRQLQKNSSFPAEVFNSALETLTWPMLCIEGGNVLLYEPTNRQGR